MGKPIRSDLLALPIITADEAMRVAKELKYVQANRNPEYPSGGVLETMGGDVDMSAGMLAWIERKLRDHAKEMEEIKGAPWLST